jgi:hypothetical protein
MLIDLISRPCTFHSDKDTIATWKLDFRIIPHVFNVHLVVTRDARCWVRLSLRRVSWPVGLLMCTLSELRDAKCWSLRWKDVRAMNASLQLLSLAPLSADQNSFRFILSDRGHNPIDLEQVAPLVSCNDLVKGHRCVLFRFSTGCGKGSKLLRRLPMRSDSQSLVRRKAQEYGFTVM